MKLPGKRILMVVAPRDFRDEELFVPRRLFESLGAKVTIASTRTGVAVGMLGGRATATTLIDTVRADDYDALLIVGGDGAAEHLWPNKNLRATIRQAHADGRLLGAICLGPVVLAQAGVVDGGEVALWRSKDSLAALEASGVRPAAEDVLASGRVITANGPLVAARWAEAIANALGEKRPVFAG